MTFDKHAWINLYEIYGVWLINKIIPKTFERLPPTQFHTYVVDYRFDDAAIPTFNWLEFMISKF